MVVLVQQCSVLKLPPATVPLDIMVLLVKINAPVAKMLALRNVGVVTVVGVHVLVHVNVLMDGMDHFVRMQMDVKIQYSHNVQFVVPVCMQRLLVVPLVLNVHEERMDNPIV
mgnify:CR=1 FL=1